MIISAPWTLHGEGFMLFYKFNPAWVKEHGLLPQELIHSFDGGFGAVMLVNYQDSPVGPYRELLFMPGKFRTPHGRKYSITSIYVNSEASTRDGRANWGIPKHTRAFQWEKDGAHEHISVFNAQGKAFFEINLRSGGWHFPVTTAFIPLHLCQQWEGKTYLTSPKGRGTGQLVRLLDMRVNAAHFPNISAVKPLLAIKVTNFQMEFPAAKVI